MGVRRGTTVGERALQLCDDKIETHSSEKLLFSVSGGGSVELD
jgi:hypothetical protein